MSSSSSSSSSSPRINYEKLAIYEGKSVTLLGTLQDITSPRIAVVMSSDKKPVHVSFSEDVFEHYSTGQILEIIGIVHGGKVNGTSIAPINSPFEMDLYNNAVNYSAMFPTLFG